MDSTERAKRAAQARKQGNKSSTSSNTYTTTATSTKTVNLPQISDRTFDRVDVVTNIAGMINFDSSSRTVDVTIPNLPKLTVDGIASSLKHTTVKEIEDIRNPGFSEDEKCDKTTFEKAKNEYEDAIRYQQLIVWANNYKGEEFKAIASAAKAYKQGLLAKTEIEGVYQQFLELAKQEHITTQKGIEYIAQSHKTATVQAGLPYSLADNESTLEKQRIKAKKSFVEAKQANTEFDVWLNSLKGKQDGNSNN